MEGEGNSAMHVATSAILGIKGGTQLLAWGEKIETAVLQFERKRHYSAV